MDNFNVEHNPANDEPKLSSLFDDVRSHISGVGDHFNKVFSNVVNGEASTGEYLEVGAIAVGTAAAARFGIGRLIQRNSLAARETTLLDAYKGGSLSIPYNSRLNIAVTRTPDAVRLEQLIAGNVPPGRLTDVPVIFGKNVVPFRSNGGKGLAIKEMPKNPSSMDGKLGEVVSKTHAFNAPFGLKTADASITINPLNSAAARLQMAFRGQAFDAGKTDLGLVKPLASDGSAFQITLPAGRTASTRGLPPPEWESTVKMPRATDEGLAKMYPSLWNNTQLRLNFKGSNVSDSGLKTIADLKGRVNSLDVRDTQVTRSGYKWIQKELPDAVVIW